MFPISPGRFRVIADKGVSQGAVPAVPTLGEVQAVIDRRGPGGVAASDPVWLAAFRINERKVAEYRSDRAFVAGDAAHVHSPAGGQGMNTGMQDAFNLAWKLALVCRGEAKEALLDSYSVERSAVGEEVLKAAGRLTAVAVMRNPVGQAVRNFVGRFAFGLAPLRRAMVGRMTEVSIGYEETPLNGPRAPGLGGPAPGQRLPPVAGQAPPGSGNRARFVLLGEDGLVARRLVEKYPTLLDPEVRPAVRPGGMWLVRPDGYVGCTARAGEAAGLEGYLDGLRA